jgi:hypothetical protein
MTGPIHPVTVPSGKIIGELAIEQADTGGFEEML